MCKLTHGMARERHGRGMLCVNRPYVLYVRIPNVLVRQYISEGRLPMTMSENHISFRMPCFHVNKARFMVSAENFMNFLCLTYDIVRSYEHDQEHVAACGSIPQSLQLDGGLHLSPVPLHVCSGVPIRRRGPIHQFHRHHCIHGM